jgi:tetratricopeptide (TPR) repeat protein
MLQTIRDHAGEQLGDGPDVRRRQADWAIALAHEAAPQLVGPDQDAWLERLELEHPNLRAALDWLLENDGRGAVVLAGSLWRFWLTRGHLQEGRDRLAAALAAERTPLALYGLAAIVYWLGDTDAADALWDEALAGYRAADDVHGIATTLNNLAMVAQYRGDLDSAQARYEEALAHCRDQPRAEAVSVLNLGILAGDRGEHDAALERFERALQLFREQGDVRATADVLGSLANQLRAADPAAAKRYAEESLEAFERLGDALGASEALQTLAGLAGGERAAELLEDALARSREAGDPWGTARALDGLARLALGAGERERARTLATEALALHERLEHPVGAAESRAILDGLG